MPQERKKFEKEIDIQINNYTITQIRVQMPLEQKKTFPWLTCMVVIFADGGDELKLFTHAVLS